MKNILWLPGWYPNRLQPFTGDFIERHAIAASLYNRITVLFLIKDDRFLGDKRVFTERRKYNDNCSALILYYRPLSRLRAIEWLFSGVRYFMFLAALIRQYIRDNGRPDLLHVHVAWRAGLLALYCRWRYKWKYIVSEHWSVFLEEARPRFRDQCFITRFFIRNIYKKAWRCSTVSPQLAGALAKEFKIELPRIIANVVDISLFRPSADKNDVFRFIHVSEFNYPKNPEQLFEAIALLKHRVDKPFNVLVFAPDEASVVRLAMHYNVRELVSFRNFIPQALLAHEISRSDALILYSRFETFGCMVIEAMAAGIPVIVSDIPVLHEIVTTNRSGIIAPLNEPAVLAEKMLWMINNIHQFDSSFLAARAAEQYSFEKIGRLFDNLYS